MSKKKRQIERMSDEEWFKPSQSIRPEKLVTIEDNPEVNNQNTRDLLDEMLGPELSKGSLIGNNIEAIKLKATQVLSDVELQVFVSILLGNSIADIAKSHGCNVQNIYATLLRIRKKF